MCRIEQLLRQTIGLDADSIGSSSIQRTVRLRMRCLGLSALDDYYRLLTLSREEWKELVEAVVVTETWFFRDPQLFEALARLATQDCLRAHPTAPLRLLCVPCSSGEEAYSALMALDEAEVPAERLHLDAADISARALARARRGVYGKNSFRGKDLAFRDRYFQHTREGFLLDPAICKRVNFFEGNLLSDDFLRGKEEYDFVFCRNLFIYFDPAMRKKALNTIHRLMSPSGVLFVGPAELPLVIEHGFVSAGIPMAFACRKAASGHGRRDARVAAYKPARFLNLPPSRPIYKISPAPAPASRPAAVVARPGRSISTDLGMAQRLADVGHLEEAAEICEAHLRLAGPSAQAYYLLGLTRDAQKDSASADFYRKALYLEPNHYETLLQMALLSQKNGDSERAFAFQSRAQKLKPTI